MNLVRAYYGQVWAETAALPSSAFTADKEYA
jgi:hypothetical protein